MAPTCGSCKKQLRIFQVSLTTSLLNSPNEALQYTAAIDQDSLIQEVLEWQQETYENRSLPAKSVIYKQFKKINSKWFFGQRIYVPDSKSLKLSVLKRYHDLATAGHQGIRRTKTKVKEHYFWPKMDQEIDKYIGTCLTCQRNADRNSNLTCLLHPLEIPTDRFKDISIDFATIPQHPDGWNQVMVVVCRLTKLVRLIPCKDTDRTDQTARRFITALVDLDCQQASPLIVTLNLPLPYGQIWLEFWELLFKRQLHAINKRMDKQKSPSGRTNEQLASIPNCSIQRSGKLILAC